MEEATGAPLRPATLWAQGGGGGLAPIRGLLSTKPYKHPLTSPSAAPAEQAATGPGPPARGVEGPSLSDPRAAPCPLPRGLPEGRKHFPPPSSTRTWLPCHYPNRRLTESSQNELVQSALSLACPHLPPAALSTSPLLLQLPAGLGAPFPAVLFPGGAAALRALAGGHESGRSGRGRGCRSIAWGSLPRLSWGWGVGVSGEGTLLIPS